MDEISGFIGFYLATLMLIALKLFDVITCSWWWVFSPILFIVGLVILILFILIIKIINLTLDDVLEKKFNKRKGE